jgi:hypothetical protein
MFCSNCGRETRETERFCASCGIRLEIKPVPQTSPSVDLESNSFENLIAARVREVRKNSASPISNTSGIRPTPQNQRQPESITDTKAAKSKRSPFLFSLVTFGFGLLAMVVGYLILPFAYVIASPEESFSSSRQFNWRLPAIASVLADRDGERYVFGPALSFLVGGYLWTLGSAALITLVAFLLIHQIGKTEEDLSDERDSRLYSAVLLGRTSLVLMSLLFTWQLTGMWTLQRAADTKGSLSGDNYYSYFSLGFGSVLSLLGIVAFAFAGASMANRATVERNI